jgi:hypothetical protein
MPDASPGWGRRRHLAVTELLCPSGGTEPFSMGNDMTSSHADFSGLVRQTRYGMQLAERRETAHIEQLANFGLSVGWVCTLLGGFCWFCVVSQLDALWFLLFATGLVLQSTAVLVPELLDVPCRLWMRLAHLQGWLIMSVLLTIIFFVLITPAGWLLRWRHGTHPFYSWNEHAPAAIGWEALPPQTTSPGKLVTERRRSLPMLLVSTVSFFYGRGHYLVLPVLIVLLVLGMVLFFVQGSVLAPFIYTIF